MLGLTESSGGCFTSIANVYPMIGTVGVPMTTIEARLESVPEMGYDALGSVPRGEICLRGNTLFSGYYKREDLTNAVLVDGWFHTGKTTPKKHKLTMLTLFDFCCLLLDCIYSKLERIARCLNSFNMVLMRLTGCVSRESLRRLSGCLDFAF